MRQLYATSAFAQQGSYTNEPMSRSEIQLYLSPRDFSDQGVWPATVTLQSQDKDISKSSNETSFKA
jgi:hypothetical protein